MLKYYMSNIHDDLLVLFIDKVLYDIGCPITGNAVSYDSEFEAYEEALNNLGGISDYDDDYTETVFRNDCLKRYTRLALKYGSINGIPKENNLWIKRFEGYINQAMNSIQDNCSYDYDFSSARKSFLKVYTLEGFTETACIIQAIASILHFAEVSCKELERLTEKRTAEFYTNYKRDIETYEERIQHFIDNGCSSAAVINRWLKRIEALKAKKATYEQVLKRRLDDLDKDFSLLQMQSQELSLRAVKSQTQMPLAA